MSQCRPEHTHGGVPKAFGGDGKCSAQCCLRAGSCHFKGPFSTHRDLQGQVMQM